MPAKTFYRYEEVIYAPAIDEDGYSLYGGTVQVEELRYKLLRETKKGVWIIPEWAASWETEEFKKWISLTARKKYACPTKEEAIVSFKERKKRQIEILEAQLATARTALELIERRSQNAIPCLKKKRHCPLLSG